MFETLLYGRSVFLWIVKMDMLKINGEEKEFADGEMPATLSELLKKLEINQAVVAEVDGQIIEQKDFVATGLKSDQSIEIIRFVGGG